MGSKDTPRTGSMIDALSNHCVRMAIQAVCARQGHRSGANTAPWLAAIHRNGAGLGDGGETLQLILTWSILEIAMNDVGREEARLGITPPIWYQRCKK